MAHSSHVTLAGLSGPPKVQALLTLADLEGAWSSDCGLMTIADGRVKDAFGEAAPISISPADGQVEMLLAGERWRSRYVDADHIQWEGDGGTWTRATAARRARTGSPPSSPTQRAFSVAGGSASQRPTIGTVDEIYERTVQSLPWPGAPPEIRERLPSTGSCPQQLLGAGSGALGSTTGLPTMPVPSSSWPAGYGGPPQALPIGPPPQTSYIPSGDPHLAQLEAKVDFLTNAVAGLQGELVRMMQVRRAGAQRRAREAEGGHGQPQGFSRTAPWAFSPSALA